MVSTGRALVLLLGLLLLAVAARAGEGESGARQAAIDRFWRQEFVVGSLCGVGGVELRYATRTAAAARGALVLVGGRTEFAQKYAELLYDLRDTGFSFYIYDHRGQGLSGRLLADRTKGHVDDFDDYVADLGLFIDRIVRPRQQQRLLLLTHSMGGIVSLLYAADHHGKFDGLILCSPMLGFRLHPLVISLLRGLCRLAIAGGHGDALVLGAELYERRMVFDNNTLTGSRERFDRNRRLVAEDPRLAIGAPTYAWLDQALAATSELRQRQPEPGVPVLLLQGAEDRVVDNRAQRQFCRLLDDCRLVRLAGARHEVLMEEDAVRNRALREIRDFMNAATNCRK